MSKNQRLNASELDDEIKQFSRESVNLGVDGKYQWPIRIFTPTLYAITLLVNYLYSGNRNKEVSDRFSIWVTPPGLFFSIWGLIFTGLAVANIYNLIKNVWNLKTHIYFGVNNLLQMAWIFLFDAGTLTSVVFASVAIITSTVTIFLTWVEMGNTPQDKVNIFTYVIRNIWALYLGWMIAASNLNFGMDMVYWWGASKQTQLVIFWVMAPLCAIGGFAYNCVQYGKYGALSCFCLWFSVAWAFIGAGIRSSECMHGNC